MVRWAEPSRRSGSGRRPGGLATVRRQGRPTATPAHVQYIGCPRVTIRFTTFVVYRMYNSVEQQLHKGVGGLALGTDVSQSPTNP